MHLKNTLKFLTTSPANRLQDVVVTTTDSLKEIRSNDSHV